MAKTKVKKDTYGLYVRSGGYVARPLYSETIFSEGDEINTSHMGGSTHHKVTFGNRSLKDGCEYWASTGDPDKQSDSEHVNFYLQYASRLSFIWAQKNRTFQENIYLERDLDL